MESRVRGCAGITACSRRGTAPPTSRRTGTSCCRRGDPAANGVQRTPRVWWLDGNIGFADTGGPLRPAIAAGSRLLEFVQCGVLVLKATAGHARPVVGGAPDRRTAPPRRPSKGRPGFGWVADNIVLADRSAALRPAPPRRPRAFTLC